MNLIPTNFLAALALPAAANPAIQPAPRDAAWIKRHEGFVAEAARGGVDVLFLGDSITDGWRRPGPNGGKAVWDRELAPLRAANFGIGGDRTQHVLWRIENGELEGIRPEAFVLMIGTNNSRDDDAAGIARGITRIVETLRTKQPQAKILLLAVFPRGERAANNAQRDKLIEVNRIISKLHNGESIHFLDIGDKFLQPDGSLTKEIMPDYLHLSAKGYQIWADAIMPLVKELTK